jgi:hypothetical protein
MYLSKCLKASAACSLGLSILKIFFALRRGVVGRSSGAAVFPNLILRQDVQLCFKKGCVPFHVTNRRPGAVAHSQTNMLPCAVMADALPMQNELFSLAFAQR